MPFLCNSCSALSGGKQKKGEAQPDEMREPPILRHGCDAALRGFTKSKIKDCHPINNSLIPLVLPPHTHTRKVNLLSEITPPRKSAPHCRSRPWPDHALGPLRAQPCPLFLCALTRSQRAFASARSFFFCAIWVCIRQRSSSRTITTPPPLPRARDNTALFCCSLALLLPAAAAFCI